MKDNIKNNIKDNKTDSDNIMFESNEGSSNVAKDSATVNVYNNSIIVNLELKFDGNFDEDKVNFILKRLVELELPDKSNPIKIKKVKRGSIIIEIQTSEINLHYLVNIFKSGYLSELIDINISDIKIISENKNETIRKKKMIMRKKTVGKLILIGISLLIISLCLLNLIMYNNCPIPKPTQFNLNSIDSIKLITSFISIFISIIAIISWIKKWHILKSIFSKYRFRYIFYRYIKYSLQPVGKYIFQYRENTYTFIDRTHINYTKKFTILNYIPNLRFFEDSYSWKKTGHNHPRELYKQQEIIFKRLENNRYIYVVRLERHYKVGEVFDVGITMDLEDEEKQSQSYIHSSVYEKTKLIELKVRFYDDLVPKNSKLLIYKDYSIPELLFEVSLAYDNINRCLYYMEKYPLFNHRYEIRWDFNE